MTSIDLYDQLVKGVDQDFLPSLRDSRASNSVHLDEFELLLTECKTIIQNIRQQNGDILRLKDRLMTTANASKQNQICAQIKKKCDANYQSITDLRQKLKQSSDLINQLKQEKPDEPETFSKIFKRKRLADQVDRIVTETFGIQKLVEKYSVETNLKRIRLILPDASNQEAMKLASNSDGLRQALTQKMTGKASKKWMYTYNDIMDKNQGIKTLEAAVAQNLRLIKQVLAMVEKQGEMIDNILSNVEQAKDYIVKAEAVLQKQKQQHKKSRKKLCCIIFLILAILAVVAVPIIIKVIQSKTAPAAA